MVRALLIIIAFVSAHPAMAGMNDIELYRAVVDEVANGSSYYETSNRLHRENDFPTQPFVTVRSPVLAHFIALVGHQIAYLTLLAIFNASVIAWFIRLKGLSLVERAVFVTILALGINLSIGGSAIYVHENWASALICLGLAVGDDKWFIRLAIMTLAAIIRELAFPILMLLLIFKPQRAFTLAGIVTVITFYAFHAWHVSLQPPGVDSQGWDAMRGPSGFVSDAVTLSMLTVAPWIGWPWITASFAGWAVYARRDVLPILWFIGVLGAISLFAREDNLFWVLIALPLLLAGPAFLIGYLVRYFASRKAEKQIGIA